MYLTLDLRGCKVFITESEEGTIINSLPKEGWKLKGCFNTHIIKDTGDD